MKKSLLISHCFFALLITVLYSCVNDSGTSVTNSENGKINLISTPTKPLEVTALNIDYKSFDVSWKVPSSTGFNSVGGVATIKEYQVEYSTNPNYNKIVSLTATTNLISIDGLTSDTDYYVRVRAINENDKTNASEYAMLSSPRINSIKTEAILPLSPPRQISRVIENNNDIQLSWEAGEPGTGSNGDRAIITGYEVEVSPDESFSTIVEIKTVSGDLTSMVLTGLMPNTEYYVRIRTVNSEGKKSVNTESFFFRTNDLSIPPDVDVTNFELDDANTTPSQIQVNWTAIASDADFGKMADGTDAIFKAYDIRYSNTDANFAAGNTITKSIEDITETSSLTSNTLMPYTDYFFMIRVESSSGKYSEGVRGFFKTRSVATEPSTPTAILREDTSTKTRLDISWTASIANKNNGEPSATIEYEVEYKESGTDTYTLVATTVTTKASIPDLTVFTDYDIRITASNKDSNTELKSTTPGETTLKTLSAAVAPDAPTGVTIAVSSTSTETNMDRYHKVNVSWTAPTNKGKLDDGITDATNINYYEVFYRRTVDPVNNSTNNTYVRVGNNITGTSADITIGDISDVAARTYQFIVKAINDSSINNISPNSIASTAYVMPDRPKTINIKVKKRRTAARARYIVYGKDSSGSDVEILRVNNIVTTLADETKSTNTTTINAVNDITTTDNDITTNEDIVITLGTTNTETILSLFYKVNLYNDSYRTGPNWIGTVTVTYLSGLSNQKVISDIPDDDSSDFIFP